MTKDMKTTTITKSTENQKDVVCFYRVSTSGQDNDRQFADVRRYCEAYDFTIVKEFEETISGKAELDDRSELKAMLKYIDENPPQYVVVSELSRLGRSNLTLQIIEKLTKMQICFISLKEGFKTLNEDKTLNHTTQLIIDILNGINKFELETIRYRVKSGLRKTANNGTWIGCVPFGYSVVNQKLIINPSESQTLIMMFQKYSEGWSNNKIASYLNINGIKTKNGVTWKDTSVYKILNNPIVIGKRNWSGETIELPELRLIEDSMFASVQDRLNKKTNVSPINKQSKYKYLLSNKIICACGKHFVGINRSDIYMCKSKKYHSGCNIKNVGMNYLDEAVVSLLKNNAKLLYDYSGISNKVKEMNDEILILDKQINDEKLTQNYLINNLSKIGQQNFDKKFDASTELVLQLQERIDNLNIKLSNTKSFLSTEDDIKIRELRIEGTGILRRIDVDKEIIRKVIDRIDIDNDNIKVSLINGSTFDITRK